MICTTIWMEVHTWSSNYLRAKGAFSDHGMQCMRGVCYAAFDVMTGLQQMEQFGDDHIKEHSEGQFVACSTDTGRGAKAVG